MNQIIVCNSPFEYLINHLKRQPVSILIITDSDCYSLAKTLVKNGHSVEICDLEHKSSHKNSIVIGVGGWFCIRHALSFENYSQLILIPDAPYGCCFIQNSFNQNRAVKKNNLVLFSNVAVEKNKLLIFVELFMLLTDINDVYILSYDVLTELKMLQNTVYEALTTDNHQCDALNILADVRFKLSNLCNDSICHQIYSSVCKINSKISEFSASSMFYMAVIINIILLCFTNHKIEGIIIGSDRVRLRSLYHSNKSINLSQKFLFPPSSDRSLTLTRSELNYVLVRFRQLHNEFVEHLQLMDIADAILLNAETTKSTGVLTRLATSGVLSEIMRSYKKYDKLEFKN